MDQVIGKYCIYETQWRDRLITRKLVRETPKCWVFEDRYGKEQLRHKLGTPILATFDDKDEAETKARETTEALMQIRETYEGLRRVILEKIK